MPQEDKYKYTNSKIATYAKFIVKSPRKPMVVKKKQTTQIKQSLEILT